MTTNKINKKEKTLKNLWYYFTISPMRWVTFLILLIFLIISIIGNIFPFIILITFSFIIMVIGTYKGFLNWL